MQEPKAKEIQVPVSAGELLDKLTILEIKMERIDDPEKLGNVAKELALLKAIHDTQIIADQKALTLTDALRNINQKLWDVEDELRAFEAKSIFDTSFVEKARSVYKLNDQRANLKRQLNVHLKSELIEEKSYG